MKELEPYENFANMAQIYDADGDVVLSSLNRAVSCIAEFQKSLAKMKQAVDETVMTQLLAVRSVSELMSAVAHKELAELGGLEDSDDEVEVEDSEELGHSIGRAVD